MLKNGQNLLLLFFKIAFPCTRSHYSVPRGVRIPMRLFTLLFLLEVKSWRRICYLRKLKINNNIIYYYNKK
jgi:hypothetical protein